MFYMLQGGGSSSGGAQGRHPGRLRDEPYATTLALMLLQALEGVLMSADPATVESLSHADLQVLFDGCSDASVGTSRVGFW